jgi:hypothetical protein
LVRLCQGDQLGFIFPNSGDLVTAVNGRAGDDCQRVQEDVNLKYFRPSFTVT